MPLSARQIEYLALAWQCFETEPKARPSYIPSISPFLIDYPKFARIANLSTTASARELMRVTKKKLKEEYGSLGGAAANTTSEAGTPTKNTPNQSPGKGNSKDVSSATPPRGEGIGAMKKNGIVGGKTASGSGAAGRGGSSAGKKTTLSHAPVAGSKHALSSDEDNDDDDEDYGDDDEDDDDAKERRLFRKRSRMSVQAGDTMDGVAGYKHSRRGMIKNGKDHVEKGNAGGKEVAIKREPGSSALESFSAGRARKEDGEDDDRETDFLL